MRLFRSRRDREIQQIMERVYSALSRLDTETESTRELIAGVNTLRYQLRGTYYALYGVQPDDFAVREQWQEGWQTSQAKGERRDAPDDNPPA